MKYCMPPKEYQALQKKCFISVTCEKLLEYCEIGVKEGATLVYGGKQCDMKGTLRLY
jgi:hypothetical protein